MPARTIPLVTGEYYHVFNRGVAYQPIFKNKRDYQRFLLAFHYYQFENIPIRLSKFLQIKEEDRENIFRDIRFLNNRLVDITAYCLMPNHFHALIKQTTDDGISRFLRLTMNSYARYFNTKYKRVGTVFQGMFKVVRIESNEQLLHVQHFHPFIVYLL